MFAVAASGAFSRKLRKVSGHREMDQHESAAAEIPAARVSDRERISTATAASIAFLPHATPRPCVGRKMLRGNHHAAGRFDGRRCSARAADTSNVAAAIEQADARSNAFRRPLRTRRRNGPRAFSSDAPSSINARSPCPVRRIRAPPASGRGESGRKDQARDSAVLPGAMLRATPVRTARLTRISSVVSSPMRGAATRVAGNTSAATPVFSK